MPPARPLGPDAEGQWVRRWTSAEWTRTVDAWVSRRLAERGRQVCRAAVTYRARFWSVVRCYSTGEGLVWFKENNPGHRFEARLVAALGELAPDDVLVPLAVDQRRGWLLTDDHGPTLTHADVASQQTRRTVVRALARLQRRLLGRVSTPLLTLAPQTAGDELRAIARTWAAFPSDHPLHLTPETLQRARQAAAHLDRRTPSPTIPLDLDFNDVYPANIFATRVNGELRPRFFDFGNTIRGHPFVTLHNFLDSVEEWTRKPLAVTDREELYATYLSEWPADPRVLRLDLEATRPLLGVHRLVSWLRLIPHADALELRTRAEIPRKYLASAIG